MTIVLVLGALVVIAAAIIYRTARAAARKHGAGALIWRWLTGDHLDGVPRTNAGWLEPGTKVLTQTGRASRWAHMPRAHRAAWRDCPTFGVMLIAAGLAANARLTVASLLTLAAAGLALGGWRAWHAIAGARGIRVNRWKTGAAAAAALLTFAAVAYLWSAAVALLILGVAGLAYSGRGARRGIRQSAHTRRWVRPLHEALGRALGMPLGVSPRSWLTVPEDFATREGAEIDVRLPDGFNNAGEDSKRLVREIVAMKLALESPNATWHLAGRDPHVTFTTQVPAPKRVTYAEVRELIAAAKPAAPLAGLGRGRKPVYIDLDLDSPHVIFSMSSGSGKSAALRTAVAQELHRGAVALILDIKRLSHAWARGLPNVRYCRSIEEIHEAALWLAAETDHRNIVADDGADIDGNTDHVDVGPRIIVVAEEMNATSNKLAKYWRQIKDKDDPSQSPAIDGLGDVYFMGRQVKVNILAVAQMFTARTIGGPEARENAGVRILGGYTVNNWRMLVPEIWPMPKKSRIKGRVQICVAGEAKETQFAFLTPAEARELATSGTVSQFPGTPAEGQGRGGEIPVRAIKLHVARTAPPIGLRQAVAEGVLPISLEAARKARTRDPEFPEHRGEGDGGEQLYDRDELAAWARNRPRATAKAAGE
jgi:hypothetical protein